MIITLWASATDPPQPQSVSLLVYLLAAAFTGGAAKVIYDAYRRWRSGPLDDQEQIGRTLRTELGSMKDLLEEYRIEQEVSKRQLDDYRRQLGDVTRALAEARVRIENLERDLERATDRRAFIEDELQVLRKQFEILTQQRDGLQLEANSLRDTLAQLRHVTGREAEVESGGGDIAP